ncbi:TPA: restriction endonuclease subunit S [Klebsiella quasipneumoniae]
MSFEFSKVSLKQISSKIGDGIHGTPIYDENGSYYFINGNNLGSGRIVITSSTKKVGRNEYLKHKKELNESTVLLSINGTIGNVALYDDEPVILGKSACYINILPDVSVRYIGYVLKDRPFQHYIKQQANGSTIKNVSLKLIRDYEFTLPPKVVQDRIAEILSSLDKKISVNENMNIILEQMAQALFKSWFVDFEPVKAKMTVLEAGGSQEDATLAAMTAISGKDTDALEVFEREHPEQYAELKATAELFPSAMRESELGEIPEGWYQTLLSELTGFLNGYAFKSKDWRETGFPVVKIGSVKPGFVDLKNCSYIDGIGIKNLERFEVFSGDILVGMTGYPGETGIIPETMQRVYLNQRVGKFTPLFEFLYSYVYTLVRNNNFKIYVSGQAHGSAQANISSNDILQYPVVKPNDALLRAFDVVVRNLISLKLKNQAQIQSLEQLRDTLLPKLLSGEITLPEAEQAVSEVENV